MKKALLPVMALLMVVECGRQVNMFVACYLERAQRIYPYYYGSRNGYIYSDPAIEQMTAYINDDSMNVTLPQGFSFYTYFNDPNTTPPMVGTEYKFDIKTNVGNATATCTLPGDYDFTYPQVTDTIPVNKVLIITWNPAADADWYAVVVQYQDSAMTYWKDTSGYTDSTSWTVPATWIKDKGIFYITIKAVKGPKVETGAVGNVNGAKGFCLAVNTREHDIIPVGTAPLAASKARPKVDSPKEFMVKYLKEMSKYNDDAAQMLEIMK